MIGSSQSLSQIRPAEPGDAPAIWALAAPYLPEGQQPTGLEATVMAKQIASDIAVGAVCTDQNGRRAPGIIGAVLVKPGEDHVWMLYIQRRWQGHGLGRTLLDLGLAILARHVTNKRSGAGRTITLRVPSGAAAEGFYRHLGWVRMHGSNAGRQQVYRFDLPGGATPPSRSTRRG